MPKKLRIYQRNVSSGIAKLQRTIRNTNRIELSIVEITIYGNDRTRSIKYINVSVVSNISLCSFVKVSNAIFMFPAISRH